MKVKWLLSAGSIEAIRRREEWVNPARYNAFVDIFGEGNIGLVSADKVINEIRTGKLTPVYLLGKSLGIRLSDKKGVQGELFLASGFDLGKGQVAGYEDLKEVMDYLEFRKTRGDIGAVVNSKYSTLFEDKKSFVGLIEKGINIPKTYHFENKEDFRNFIGQNGRYVVKHRFGSNGDNNFLIDSTNVDSLENKVISDYVVQELVPIISETRMIFYKGDFLGARKITDRTRPWEEKSASGRKHKVEMYNPTSEEISRARFMFRYARGVVGAIDSVQLKEGGEKILEFNGIATGLGYPRGVYDLNHIVAERLKSSYL